ncbi:ABC transporter permease [Luteimicrobium xylanilyticum]|uniref:Putative D,D-dipeptide transport system permease protein DdpB n=1 Tax=Luteimicrobium xylanilyticum TaxID=1133546 RepID=A0A5P9QDU6_9MICO|nr:ABC transporter permease [Luteimicrobium xylanilyticum]QFU99634.1 putative D,D-dipeptide transport system permease protein DdpB [Luteimicrobium xylanilyticum]
MTSATLLPSAGDAGAVAREAAPAASGVRGRAWATTLAAVGRRLVGAVVVLWASVTVAFVALQLAPGSAIDALVPPTQRTPEAVAAVTAEWGLDRPVVQQYVDYLTRLLHGDLGTSYQLHRPVTDVIVSELGPTLQLAAAGLAVALVLAVLLAVSTAGRPWASRIANGVELTVVSVPEFWLGIVLLFVFSFSLGWFPVAGANGLASLVLPATALGLGLVGLVSQVLREGVERSLEQPYTLSVRARGVSETALRVRHSLRHASLPVVTLLGWLVGGLLGGVIIVEQVFGRPGIGVVALQAAQGRDLPVVLGVALLSALVYVVVNTAVDLLALVIDPRLRTGGRA